MAFQQTPLWTWKWAWGFKWLLKVTRKQTRFFFLWIKNIQTNKQPCFVYSICCALFSAERFQLLTKAKEILTDPESRSKYDKWRRSGIAMSYDNWCGLRGAVHTVSYSQCFSYQFYCDFILIKIFSVRETAYDIWTSSLTIGIISL
jgi:hypothetical protein